MLDNVSSRELEEIEKRAAKLDQSGDFRRLLEILSRSWPSA